MKVWSGGGHEWAAHLPELAGLAGLGDGTVVDRELVVVTADGRADFDLLSRRLFAGRPEAGPQVNLFVFDVLRHHGRDLVEEPWYARRAVLQSIDVAGVTAGSAQLVTYSDDPAAMWAATATQRVEGVEWSSKAIRSTSSDGRRCG